VPSRHSCQDAPGNRGGRDFLALLGEDDRVALERLGRTVSFPPGTVLMHEGMPAEVVMLLLSGTVKVTSITHSGREVVLAFCGPGHVIGEMAAIDAEPHGGTVVSIEPVEALLVPIPGFRSFLAERPTASTALLRMLGTRFRDADRKLIEFGASDALGRVASRLVELSETHGQAVGDTVVISLQLSQEELAGWAGCSQKATVNALRTLRELGLVETARRRVTVLDPQGLRARAPVP
jgi:CRP-like cAMP-binding protein